MTVSKIDETILLGKLKGEISWADWDKLNLKHLDPLRLEVNHRLAELIRKER